MVAARAYALSCLAVVSLALASCARPPAPPPPPPAPAPRPTPSPESLPCERVERIEVTKRSRTLVARCEGGGERRFTVALSRVPEGAKERKGDQRVPEGSYRLVGKPLPSRFHRFWRIDYPSPADAERAFAEGRISGEVRGAILRAHDRGALPPQRTALGGIVGLHGEGERWRGDSEHLDWTYGCIALSDADLDFLILRAAPGTPVEIAP
ncbi:MAG TPA: L,D-transpeptidase [Myxococcota bacterium]|jgi:hypothetical protein|nr:L,D-transpeptidase [Myxococcota bacterium]